MADFRETLMIIQNMNNSVLTTYCWSIEKEDLSDGCSTFEDWSEECTLGQAVDKLIDFLSDSSKLYSAIYTLLDKGRIAVSEEY